MMVTSAGPGLVPKGALTTSRLIYKPFAFPAKLNQTATDVGKVNHDLVRGLNATIGNAYGGLKPRGPAKWLMKIFQRVDQAVAISEAKATRNKNVFWDPFSTGM